MRNLDSMIRGKLGEAFALSPWTKGRLEEMIHLIDAYAAQKYEEGYQAAMMDAQSLAKRVCYGGDN